MSLPPQSHTVDKFAMPPAHMDSFRYVVMNHDSGEYQDVQEFRTNADIYWDRREATPLRNIWGLSEFVRVPTGIQMGQLLISAPKLRQAIVTDEFSSRLQFVGESIGWNNRGEFDPILAFVRLNDLRQGIKYLTDDNTVIYAPIQLPSGLILFSMQV